MCIELEFSEGVIVASGSLEEPVTDRLIHEGRGFIAPDKDYAVRVAFRNGPVLAKSTRLQKKKGKSASGQDMNCNINVTG